MDHKNLDDLVVDYLYGEMDSEQRAEFEAALSKSPEVQRDIEALRRTRETVQKLDEFEPPVSITDALMREAERRAPRASREGFLDKVRGVLQLLVMHPAMSAAATLVVVLGVSFYVYRQGAPTPTTSLKSDLPALESSGQATISPPTSAVQGDRKSESGYLRKAAVPAVATNDEVAPRTTRQAVSKGLGGVTRKLAPKPTQVVAGESQQIMNRDKRIRTVASNAPAVRARRGATPRVYRAAERRRPRTAKRPARRMKRASPGRADVDDLLDSSLGSGGGKRGKAKGRREAKAAPTAHAQAAAAAPPQKKARPRTKKTKKQDQRATAATWLGLGHRAVASKRCADAFSYYTSALRADPSLVGKISGKIGPCMGALRRARKSYGYLASRIHVARQRYDYNEKRARKRRSVKAKRKPVKKKNAYSK